MSRSTAVDTALVQRSRRLLPRGMYGHMATAAIGPGYPQFFSSGHGGRVTDVDGNTYIDLMCGWGPIILGHHHPGVDRAVAVQRAAGDCLNGPSPVMLDLAERLVSLISPGGWTMFAKNGSDVTSMALRVARAATGRATVLAARKSYHGSDPWSTPGQSGVTAADRADIDYYEYNDMASVEAAVAAHHGDVAAIVVCPVRHDSYRDQEPARLEFARGLRALSDRIGAVLVLDEVRTGFRLAHGLSWEHLGISADLSAWSKGIANGHPLACLVGVDALRDAAASIFVTGSFWMSSAAMAASLATLTALQEQDAIAHMTRLGTILQQGMAAAAAAHGVQVTVSGPPQLPFLTFAGDKDFAIARRWAALCIDAGVYVHPTHNWFLNAAHTEDDIMEALEKMDRAFAQTAAEVSIR